MIQLFFLALVLTLWLIVIFIYLNSLKLEANNYYLVLDLKEGNIVMLIVENSSCHKYILA